MKIMSERGYSMVTTAEREIVRDISDVKKVSKKKVSITKKSNEVAKKNAKGGKVTKAVKSKPSSSKSKVSGVAKKKVLAAKPKKIVKSQGVGVGKVRKVAKQAKK